MDYDALRLEAIALRRQGFSLAQIGRRLGRKSGTIHRWVAHVQFHEFCPESLAEQLATRRDPDRYRRAHELRAASYSYSRIEAELGVARSTLHHWFRDEPDHAGEVARRARLARARAARRSVEHNEQLRQRVRQVARQELLSILGGWLEQPVLQSAGRSKNR